MRRDDQRLGELFRRLRRVSDLTQEELSAATQIPVRDICKLEAGSAGELHFDRIRRLFAELDARARVSVWWHGAAADRLLDERHADLIERASRVLARLGWQVPTEVTYSEYGERGSIDLFGLRPGPSAVMVGEVKSAFGSLEELNRSHDAKVRLAPKLCRDRFGWTPRYIARVLIVPDQSTIRRVVAAHRQTLDGGYAARSRELRAWLRRPDRSIGAIWFLSDPPVRRMGSDMSLVLPPVPPADEDLA